MNLSPYRLVLLVVLLSACPLIRGQQAYTADNRTSAATASGTGTAAQDAASIEQVPRVPGLSSPLRSLNAGLTFSGVNDPTSGWYCVITPAVSYSLNQHFSADLSFSAYLDRSVESETTTESSGSNPGKGASGSTTTTSWQSHSDPGDLVLGLHATVGRDPWRNMFTTNLTFPTGSKADGLSTGKVTFDFSNRLERSVGPFAVLVDVGVGNSAGLVNSLVTKQYDSLGALSHYQTGISWWLPGSLYIQSVGYEQLPFGRQTMYYTQQTQTQNGTSTTTASATFNADDFGITTFVSYPLRSHLLLNGYYNRSLRENYNTYSIGTTFVLRRMQKRKHISLIDRALIEAETGQ